MNEEKTKNKTGFSMLTLDRDDFLDVKLESKIKLLEEPVRRAIKQLRILSDCEELEISQEGRCDLHNLALWLEGVMDERSPYVGHQSALVRKTLKANASAHPIESPQQVSETPAGKEVTESNDSPERRDLGAATCSPRVYGSFDLCWRCREEMVWDGEFVSERLSFGEAGHFIRFEWVCTNCGYYQKSKYPLILNPSGLFSVKETPLSRKWTGGDLPQHTPSQLSRLTHLEKDRGVKWEEE